MLTILTGIIEVCLSSVVVLYLGKGVFVKTLIKREEKGSK